MAKDEKPKEFIELKSSFRVRAGMSATVSIYGKLPDGHPFYAMVGRVASEWSHVEHILDTIIWKLAGTAQSKAACITSQIMGVEPRCKAIHNLCTLYKLRPETLKNVRRLMNDSYCVADLRARIVHDPWYIETGTNVPGQFKAMPYSEPYYGHQDIKEGEISKTLAEIHTLRDAASALRLEIFGGLEASRKKPR